MDVNRSGSSSVGRALRACAAAATRPAPPSATAPTSMSSADGLAALLPDQDAEHDAAHAERPTGPRRRRRPAADRCRARRGPARCPDSTTAMITASSRKPTRQDRKVVMNAAEQRPDRGGDRRRGADQRVDLLLRRALEVAVDQRLHRRQQQRRAEPADDRPEDDDRGQALRQRHRHARRRRSRAGRGRRPACGRSGRRPCCRSG